MRKLRQAYHPKIMVKSRPAAVQAGISLIEVAISIMILGVLSIGVSSLVKTGFESQMAQRTQSNMQTVALNIVDDLRMDLRTATDIQLSNGNNTLSLNGGQIVYQLAANNMTRTEAGTVKTYNDPNLYRPALQVACPGGTGCFQPLSLNNDPTPLPRQILINQLDVLHVLPNGNAGTIIDQNFGPPRFTLRQTTFDITNARELQ